MTHVVVVVFVVVDDATAFTTTTATTACAPLSPPRRTTSAMAAAAPDPRIALGRRAEDLAAEHLAARGWTLLDRNHRAARGEVDLVFRDGRYVRFVEVRSRTGEAQGHPEESVGRGKARRVIAAATDWALGHGGLDQRFRFDVVAVTFPEEGDASPEVRVFLDAFDGDGRPGMW